MSARVRLLPVWLAALTLAIGEVAHAQEVPAAFRAALFKKILDYDRTLGGKVPNVLLLESTPGDSKDLQEAFKKVGGVVVEVAPISAPGDALLRAHVVHVKEVSAVIKATCLGKKLLSFSSDPKLVEGGHVSVSLKMRASGRPEILVHLERSKQEGHELASDLLKLATVIR
jgi:hypothetical protein